MFALTMMHALAALLLRLLRGWWTACARFLIVVGILVVEFGLLLPYVLIVIFSHAILMSGFLARVLRKLHAVLWLAWHRANRNSR